MSRRKSKIDDPSPAGSRDINSNSGESSIGGSVEAKLIEQLNAISARLRRNDPEFRRLDVITSSSISSTLLLDHDGVNRALQECWRACTGNRHVRTVVLTALPESELRRALQRGVSRLEDLHSLVVQETLRSQSLTCEDLRAFCTAHMPVPSLQRRGLRSLKLDVRIAVPSQTQLDAFANTALQLLSYLEHIQLHFLPRCSIQEPTLDVHSLLQTLANLATASHSNNGNGTGNTNSSQHATSSSKLHTIQLTLGYDHNPFRKPMIRETHVLQQLLSSSRLERLQLDNFGFGDEHLVVILRALRTNATLKHLQLARHHSAAFSLKAVQDLCATLEHHNVTLQSCILCTNGCRRRQQEGDPAVSWLRLRQEHLDMWCLLNRLGRGKLIAASKVQTTAHATRARSTMKHQRRWWDMVLRLASTDRRRRRPPLPHSSLLLFAADENSQEQPPTYEELASSRTSLGAIFTLVRAHPQMIVDGAVGASPGRNDTSSMTSDGHVKSKPTTASEAFAANISGSQTRASATTGSVEHSSSVRSSRRRIMMSPPRNRSTGKKARHHDQQQQQQKT